jgi:hypothetical protein
MAAYLWAVIGEGHDLGQLVVVSLVLNLASPWPGINYLPPAGMAGSLRLAMGSIGMNTIVAVGVVASSLAGPYSWVAPVRHLKGSIPSFAVVVVVAAVAVVVAVAAVAAAAAAVVAVAVVHGAYLVVDYSAWIPSIDSTVDLA